MVKNFIKINSHIFRFFIETIHLYFELLFFVIHKLIIYLIQHFNNFINSYQLKNDSSYNEKFSKTFL